MFPGLRWPLDHMDRATVFPGGWGPIKRFGVASSVVLG
jgi:hypothetical protein